MLFGRRNKGNRRPPHLRGDSEPVEREFYTIDYDMMVKGSIYKRRNGLVRQFGVTVNGSTRLVTSGDTVDRATYRALVQAGALRTGDEERNALLSRLPESKGDNASAAHERESLGLVDDESFPDDGR